MKTEINVIDPEGKVQEIRELVNIPLPDLYDQDMAIIDWMAHTRKRPVVEQLIQKAGDYTGWYYWGSAVKKGVTIGAKEPFLDERMVKFAEDGQRVGRYLFAEGHWGKYNGKLRVKISPINTMTQYGLIHDGAGFVRKGLVDEIATRMDKIQLGRARESYMFWQRIPWSDKLAAEIEPILSQQILDASDISRLLMQYSPASFDEKKELYELNKEMELHPYIVNAIARSSGEYLARMATTANVGTKCGVIVPIHDDLCVPGWDNIPVIGYRHPVDSYGSIQAMVNSNREEKYVKYGLSQYTLASHDLFVKGVSREVETDEFDVWICNEDIKLAEMGVQEARNLDYIEIDGVYAITQRHKEGTAIGVNISKYKDIIGCDGDGDILDIVDGKAYPALYEAVQSQPEGQTPKLEKTKSPLDQRPEMIYKSAMNLVGFATHLTSNTLQVVDRDRVAKGLGHGTESKMDLVLNLYIKIGTDGYKTNVDQEQARKEIAITNTNLQRMLGGDAPYPDWPNDRAFKHSVPQIWHPDMDKLDAKEAIYPWMDATVPNICRRTLPGLYNILDEPFKVNPLTHYRKWVPKPSPEMIEKAKVLQDWYNAHASKTNWQDSDSILNLKSKWLERIESEEPDRELACALWYVAHSTRSEESGAGSVFMGFHEDTCWIVANANKRVRDGLVTVLVGMQYQAPKLSEFHGEVEVVDVPIKKNGKIILRKAVVAEIEGQLQPQDKRYPKNMIALVAINETQPDAGRYRADIVRYSRNTHQVMFSTPKT